MRWIFFSFPWGSKLRRTRKRFRNGFTTRLLTSIVGLTFLFILGDQENKTEIYIYIYIYMENLTTYHLLLNYLTKQPFCQSISENTSILELDIAHVEFCLELDISNIKFQKHGYFVIYFENMTILLYTSKIKGI